MLSRDSLLAIDMQLVQAMQIKLILAERRFLLEMHKPNHTKNFWRRARLWQDPGFPCEDFDRYGMGYSKGSSIKQ
jgi:hypothetical protein